MRRAAVILVAIALGGCGASDEPERAAGVGGNSIPKGDWGPEQPGSGERARPAAPPRKAPSAAIASALAGGTVGVVGVEGVVGVKPSSLDVSADATLDGVTWERWGSGAAEGTGTLRVRDCDPTCASGGKDAHPARIKLSAPRLCGRSTYFDRARVELDGAPTPATYVRAPC